MKHTLIALAAAAAMIGNPGVAFSSDTVSLNAVGTWSSLPNYRDHEGPFFNEVIGEASGGKIVGKIRSQSGLGLSGFEIMRLVKNGVFDFAFGVQGYVAENAVLEGADLSSIVQDFATQRKVAEAYFPIVEKAFAENYDAKLMMLYPFPSQMLWCKGEVNDMADLAGKKIRVYSATLGDFVEAVGGVSVTVPFAEVVPALEKGVVDCGITGTTSAYNAKWHQVATHAYTMRVGFGLSFGAMNMKSWEAMSPEQQEILTKELSALNERMWEANERDDAAAISCITGGECSLGEPGGMVLVEPSAADLAKRDELAKDVIVARWAERCGSECAAQWNETVGAIIDMKAPTQ